MEEQLPEGIEMDAIDVVGDLEWIDSKPREKIRLLFTKNPQQQQWLHCGHVQNFPSPDSAGRLKHHQAARLNETEGGNA